MQLTELDVLKYMIEVVEIASRELRGICHPYSTCKMFFSKNDKDQPRISEQEYRVTVINAIQKASYKNCDVMYSIEAPLGG